MSLSFLVWPASATEISLKRHHNQWEERTRSATELLSIYLSYLSLTGQGFFCHLYGLYDLATSKDQKLHSLFTDCGVLNGFTLSTSTVSIPSMKMAVFAPDVPEGFGIHYSFQENIITFSISSYLTHSCQELSQSVYKSLEDILTVLEEKPLT